MMDHEERELRETCDGNADHGERGTQIEQGGAGEQTLLQHLV